MCVCVCVWCLVALMRTIYTVMHRENRKTSQVQCLRFHAERENTQRPRGCCLDKVMLRNKVQMFENHLLGIARRNRVTKLTATLWICLILILIKTYLYLIYILWKLLPINLPNTDRALWYLKLTLRVVNYPRITVYTYITAHTTTRLIFYANTYVLVRGIANDARRTDASGIHLGWLRIDAQPTRSSRRRYFLWDIIARIRGKRSFCIYIDWCNRFWCNRCAGHIIERNGSDPPRPQYQLDRSQFAIVYMIVMT